MVDTNAPFELTQEYADAINALLPACKYVVGIRRNETGAVRFCPENLLEWEEHSLSWWSHGNMSCDCNRHLVFNNYREEAYNEAFPCGETRYTLVGIWLPDGSSIRDLDQLNDFWGCSDETIPRDCLGYLQEGKSRGKVERESQDHRPAIRLAWAPYHTISRFCCFLRRLLQT